METALHAEVGACATGEQQRCEGGGGGGRRRRRRRRRKRRRRRRMKGRAGDDR
jgi:hypothetical protein